MPNLFQIEHQLSRMADAFERIADAFTASPEPDFRAADPEPRVADDDLEIRNLLADAVTSYFAVYLTYRKPGEAPKARHVQPLELSSRGGVEYLGGIDLEADEYRTFRLDRIEWAGEDVG